MMSVSKYGVLKSVGVSVLALSFFMTSNAAVAEEEITISVETFEKLMERLERVETELAVLKDEKKKQDSMVDAELAELKDEKKKQDSMVEAELAALKDEKKKQDSMVEAELAALKEDKGFSAGAADIDSSGYYVEAELLYLKAFSSRSTAISVIDVDLLGASESLITADFDGEFDPGYRVEIGYMPQQGLGWAARYWHFDQTQDAFAIDDVKAVFFDDPDIDIDDNGAGIFAEREFDLDVGDIAATFVTRSGNTMVKYSAGIRFLDSEMSGFWTDNTAGGDIVTLENDWDGAGPLLGIHFTHPIFQNSSILVNVYAGGSAAILYGDGHLFAVQADPTPSDVVSIEREDGLVYNAELRFGLEAIMRPSPKSLFEFFATIGLEGQYWANIGTIASAATDSSDVESADAMLEGDLGLLGGTVMFGVRSEF